MNANPLWATSACAKSWHPNKNWFVLPSFLCHAGAQLYAAADLCDSSTLQMCALLKFASLRKWRTDTTFGRGILSNITSISRQTRLLFTSIGQKGEIMHQAKPTRTFRRLASRPGARGEWPKHAIGPGGEGRNLGLGASASGTVCIFARSILPSSRSPLTLLPTLYGRCLQKN